VDLPLGAVLVRLEVDLDLLLAEAASVQLEKQLVVEPS